MMGNPTEEYDPVASLHQWKGKKKTHLISSVAATQKRHPPPNPADSGRHEMTHEEEKGNQRAFDFLTGRIQPRGRS